MSDVPSLDVLDLVTPDTAERCNFSRFLARRRTVKQVSPARYFYSRSFTTSTSRSLEVGVRGLEVGLRGRGGAV